MPSDITFLEFSGDDNDSQASSQVFDEYLKHIANKKLRRYKQIVQYGGKEGQSYYGHVMDLVSVAEKLRPAIGVEPLEMRCVLLALTIHDINKISPWNVDSKGKEVKYADAATLSNIQQELENLEPDAFFSNWRDYVADIRMLALLHQEALTGSIDTFDQRNLAGYRLNQRRLFGPLKHLMKAADTSDNSHSGDHRDLKERHLRDKLLQHINSAMPTRRYRFMGHRLAELRGLFTNVLHNALVAYFKEKYGDEACIDLLYYPEGVNYLLDEEIALEWNDSTLRDVATKAEKRLAEIQLQDLAQFIKGKPWGIAVDDAAISSGATVADIFEAVVLTVLRKQYKADWRELRNGFAHKDLEVAASDPKTGPELKSQLTVLLEQTDLITPNQTALQCGEFASAYRNFLEKHRASQLKALKQDTWLRVYQLFRLPEANYPIYSLIDPYRRGYFLARDLPELDVDVMKEQALTDLITLEQEADNAKTGIKPKKAKSGDAPQLPGLETPEAAIVPLETGYLLDYLKRNLEVWDSSTDQSELSKPVMTLDFGDSLRQYANAKRPHEQCCHCGSSLKAEEWMSAQVPPNIGVQSFSNRLEGGSQRDPKRNVCSVCRAQFILEKLAWRSHRDKQGAEQVTFYLHLFPYTFFTKPLLRAWWLSLEKLRAGDHTAFFLDTRTYFRQQAQAEQNNTDLMTAFETNIQGFGTGVNGLGLPMLSDAMSNTPVLPIVAPGENYGEQFMLALEKAVVLVRWFECRAILSRSPVPPLNLAHQKIDKEYPVVLMVEGMPRNLSWLLPETSLYRQRERPGVVTKPQYQFDQLCERLGWLHLLSQKLYYRGSKTDAVPHDFAVAAADDPLALYFEADRLIEKKIAEEKGTSKGSPEQQALYLSRDIAPILERLTKI